MTDLLVYLPLVLGLLVTGVFAGLIAGLFGVGGGIVMVPVMSIVFGILGFNADVYHHVAVGTSLAVIISTGFVSARSHFKRNAVMIPILKLWAPFIISSSLLGGLMSRYYSGDVLRIMFGVIAFLLAVNAVLPFQEKLMGQFKASLITNRLSAFVIGYVSALMGIGGGSLSVPTLTAFGNTIHKAVGTSAALGVLLAIPAAIGFVISGWDIGGRPPFSFGYVNMPALLLVGLTASLVAPVGAFFAHRLDQKRLKLGFAIFLIIVSVRMIIEAFAG